MIYFNDMKKGRVAHNNTKAKIIRYSTNNTSRLKTAILLILAGFCFFFGYIDTALVLIGLYLIK